MGMCDRSASACTLALLLAVTAGLQDAAGQTVTVMVVDESVDRPAWGALVELLSTDGAVVRRQLTDDRGRALLLGFAPGTYEVRAEAVGLSTGLSGQLAVPLRGSVSVELQLAPAPIQLRGLAVGGDRRCTVRPSDGLLVAQLWSEVRKALTNTEFVRSQPDEYLFRTELYERDLDLQTFAVLDEDRSEREGRMRTPFESRPAADLIENGFIQPSEGTELYFAPDAHVLLSDEFGDTHCFHLAERELDELDGPVGLRFRPVPGRGSIPDIRGTLWLDAETSELQRLDYWYENVPHDIASDSLGGRVAFRRMPEGRWIVTEWWIRMPNLESQRSRDYRSRVYVAGFRQVGGTVLEAVGAGGRVSLNSFAGALEGVVTDEDGEPARRVLVELLGTEHEATTDSLGFFRFRDLAEGIYRVSAVDSEFGPFGFRSDPVSHGVLRGEVSTVEVRLPSLGHLNEAACAQMEAEAEGDPTLVAGGGIVSGWFVTDADEPTGAGRTVTIEWADDRLFRTQSDPQRDQNPGARSNPATVSRRVEGFSLQTDSLGFFRFCAVPERKLLTLRAHIAGEEYASDTIRISDSRGAEVKVLRRR